MTTFAEKYAPKYDKAVECLIKDRQTLLMFSDLPADHWDHLRTSNPIESVFTTVRHRTIRMKGALSQDTARLMVFKLVMAASRTWRRLQGQNQLPKVVNGITFKDENRSCRRNQIRRSIHAVTRFFCIAHVWVIAATNRLDMIDEALLRPGRLDFRLEVTRPDRDARAAILEVHLRRRPIDQKIDRDNLAELTEGMSAAEVRFLCDRAAMNAIRREFPLLSAGSVDASALRIDQRDFDEALVEQTGGSERPKSPQPVLFERFDNF